MLERLCLSAGLGTPYRGPPGRKLEEVSGAIMEEADLLKERLQAITDKRKIQENIAKKRRQIEEEKLKLQYIKKKALREQWLMDGLSQQSEEEQEAMRLQAHDEQQQSDQLQSNILRYTEACKDRVKPKRSQWRKEAAAGENKACQPRQPHNIQRLEVLRADLIHPRRLATEELELNYLSDFGLGDGRVHLRDPSLRFLIGRQVGGIEEILEVFLPPSDNVPSRGQQLPTCTLAKTAYTQRIQGHFTSNDPRSMWRGIKCITDYNTRDAQCPRDPSLPDALNNFYARFDDPNTSPSTRFTPPPGEEPLRVTAAEVRRTLQRINPRKAAGPDNISGRVLKGCAYQLTEVLTDIFNTSLQQAVVPTCLKTATIIPIPKTSTVTGLNDYRPVALTPIVMKCFERLVMAHIKDCVDVTVDPHQYAYRKNRSTEDAISSVVHTALTHLENKDSYVRLLFVDFNLCVQYNYTADPGPETHNTRTELHPVFADDTAVVGRIANNDESDYRQEVEHLEGWCRQNNLCINVKKTKEMIVDFRRGRHLPSPLYIGGTAVEVVSSFRYLGVHISDDLTWSKNTSCLIRKAHQRLYFLRRLRRAGLGSSVLNLLLQMCGGERPVLLHHRVARQQRRRLCRGW
ncbi:hypothetical protein L3Q82_017873 [Scortum barcoo]|uniref:Uncharacterized protein n=1 Tax=Scortum barcoo TaxID=214431 RepID=A0ACB8VHY7_9TELE|nr:hypothetical protein L3Q82_017873 [Scortum barcoo]